MKKETVFCPYCHSKAILRSAHFVHNKNTVVTGKHLYVCANWPACDAYVSAHNHNLRPMGVLANGELRNQRILAHRALERYRKETGMTRRELYIWLRTKLELAESDAHVAAFTGDQCSQVIRLCEDAGKQNPSDRNVG